MKWAMTFHKEGEADLIDVFMPREDQVVVARRRSWEARGRWETDGRFGGRSAAEDARAYWQVRVARLFEQGWVEIRS